MSKKLDNVKIVTFKEDYNPSGKMVIYKKGETHAIHKDVFALFGDKVQATAKDFDEKKEKAAAKDAFEKAKKEEKLS